MNGLNFSLSGDYVIVDTFPQYEVEDMWSHMSATSVTYHEKLVIDTCVRSVMLGCLNIMPYSSNPSYMHFSFNRIFKCGNRISRYKVYLDKYFLSFLHKNM